MATGGWRRDAIFSSSIHRGAFRRSGMDHQGNGRLGGLLRAGCLDTI